VTPFDLHLDPRSPVPLYHQIAEALRYRIATGAIAIGAVLPPLRDAARTWGVNLHTVRRAYGVLAEAGIVATQAPLGTQVLPGGADRLEADAARPGKGSERAREAFFRRVIGEARERHGLSLPQLLASLERRVPPAGATTAAAAAAAVRVAECSLSQSTDLARQIGERWRVQAIPWPIDRPEPPPRSPVVATYFHYNDLRLRWPDRFSEIRFLAISPDPGLPKRLRGGRARGGRTTVVLCERDESMLRNIAADLSRLLPQERFRLVPKVTRRPAGILDAAGPRHPVLVSPRIWGDLPGPLRDDPRVHEVRYVFDPKDLNALGREFGWAPRQEV
jgi:DNA-binding transcriptional regulator YhcF (GntR family)